ncbi:DNA-binding PadR family transcriptional regulator [Conyzicola lurida]|uniref:DNA-binding PadR family transcriptional regulator n=1 Tax=Conyzicola lurida TaxID=1172621 RepID=A0A841AKU4_9MICO|nr:PadR family transcriptional regulator [Conyzicola lurida]MBB5842582.1 DNA-binding PadR family transcriptional regulator [Conyzicola lurida]
MSSVRLYILGALAAEGPMHGHQLRLLAEQEHVHYWTDVSVGSLYGAIKRLAAEGLITELRVEREGNYPERQVYALSEQGTAALADLRREGLNTVVFKPDPFDLAMSRLDPDRLDDVAGALGSRLVTLRTLLAESEAQRDVADKYLTVNERFILSHKSARLRAEIEWHEALVTQLPIILADESARTKASS